MSRTSRRSDTKSAMHKECQGQNPKNIVARVRRRFHSISGTQFGSTRIVDAEAPIYAHVETPLPESKPEATSNTSTCALCGKSVRVRKDGSLYKHNCV